MAFLSDAHEILAGLSPIQIIFSSELRHTHTQKNHKKKNQHLCLSITNIKLHLHTRQCYSSMSSEMMRLKTQSTFTPIRAFHLFFLFLHRECDYTWLCTYLMKSPSLKLALFSWEGKISCWLEGPGCCHQTPENPAKQDLILQSWLLLPSEVRAPQSKDCRVKPHCIEKKPLHKSLGAGEKALPGLPLPAPPSPTPESPRWLPSCHHPPLSGSQERRDIIMQISPPGNPVCFQIPFSSPDTLSFECRRG